MKRIGKDAMATLLALMMTLTALSGCSGTDEELMNRYEFSIRIAKTFGLDESLINPISTNELNQIAKRPLKSGLVSKFLSRKIKIKPLKLDNSLSDIKKRLNK